MLQGKEKKEKYREATRFQIPTELLAPRAMHKHPHDAQASSDIPEYKRLMKITPSDKSTGIYQS